MASHLATIRRTRELIETAREAASCDPPRWHVVSEKLDFAAGTLRGEWAAQGFPALTRAK